MLHTQKRTNFSECVIHGRKETCMVCAEQCKENEQARFVPCDEDDNCLQTH